MGVDQLTPRLVGGGQGDERGGAFGAHAVAQAAQFGDAVDGDTGSLATTTLPLADRQREPRGAEGALAAPALRADGVTICAGASPRRQRFTIRGGRGREASLPPTSNL